MKKKIIQLAALTIFLSLPLLFITGCYNDSKEYLYPVISECDTSVIVSYTGIVKPITDANCLSCHSGSSPNGNINIENYSQLKALADDGRLISVINGANGKPLMPQTGALPDCEIYIIEKWVKAGAPNN